MLRVANDDLASPVLIEVGDREISGLNVVIRMRERLRPVWPLGAIWLQHVDEQVSLVVGGHDNLDLAVTIEVRTHHPPEDALEGRRIPSPRSPIRAIHKEPEGIRSGAFQGDDLVGAVGVKVSGEKPQAVVTKFRIAFGKGQGEIWIEDCSVG